jgi:hypothetical protein
MNTRNYNDHQMQNDLQNEKAQGVDKAPGEEKDRNEKVKPENLKGKKVDADPERESDKPVEGKREN